MAISALSTLLIWVVPKSEVAIVVLSCVFNALSAVGWNALDVLGTSELFPVNVRWVGGCVVCGKVNGGGGEVVLLLLASMALWCVSFQ